MRWQNVSGFVDGEAVIRHRSYGWCTKSREYGRMNAWLIRMRECGIWASVHANNEWCWFNMKDTVDGWPPRVVDQKYDDGNVMEAVMLLLRPPNGYELRSVLIFERV